MTARLAGAAVAALLAVSRASVICAGADATCGSRSGGAVRWVRTAPAREQLSVDRWCGAVGPPARIAGGRGSGVLAGRFAVATWNTHVGAADLDGFVADLRAGRLTGGKPIDQFVLLLQEVFRQGADVPGSDRHASRWAGGQRPFRKTGPREDIVAIARHLGLDALYVPSMRNGAPPEAREDRGNAILSTVPLADPTAIELPLERQRRVAVQAAVRVRTTEGAIVPVTIVDTHFTNMVMHHLWLLSESGRLRQARALAGALPAGGALVIGGDFNAWFGFHDAAFRELARIAPPAPDQDRRPSFGPMRLDHVLFRLPAGWRAALRRAAQRYGSDHYPLIATIDPG